MRFGQVCSSIAGEGGSLDMDVAGGALDALNDELKGLEEVWRCLGCPVQGGN